MAQEIPHSICNYCEAEPPTLFLDWEARQVPGSYPCNYSEDGTSSSDPAPSEQCIINATEEMRSYDYAVAGVSPKLDLIKTLGYNWRVHVAEGRYRYRIAEGTNTYMKYVVEEYFTPEGGTRTLTGTKTLTWSGPGTAGNDASWATSWQYLDLPSVEGTKSLALIRYQFYTGGPWSA